MSDLNLYLFGLPRIMRGTQAIHIERRKALGLGAYLALAERPQARDLLAALFWPTLDQEHARAALRRTLPTLTMQDSGILQTNRVTVMLNYDVIWCDVHEFLSLLAQTRAHGHASNETCVLCVPLFEQAVTLYQDDFAASFTLPQCAEYEAWQMAQREWLRLELAGTLQHLIEYYSANNNHARAIHHARHWLTLDTLHEPAHRALMRSYAASGRGSEALRQYQICVALLEEELATLPEAETTHLYRSIVVARDDDGSPALKPIGLLPHLPKMLLGRESALAEMKQRLGIGAERRPLTVVQGWPGVGKSTTVAALAHDPDVRRAFPDGVLWTSLGDAPQLLPELLTWAQALHLPRPNPPDSLDDVSAQITAALRERRMLLVVDDVWQIEHAAPFQVGGQRCATIMTTRLNGVAQSLAPAASDIYRLPVLSDYTSLELLNTLAPDTVKAYPRQARALTRNLEGLPLAFQIAGRLLNSEAHLGLGLSGLLDELREGTRLLSAELPEDIVRRERTPTIAALLGRSIEGLDAEIRQRFADLALFVPRTTTFGRAVMAVTWHVQDPRPIARILVNSGLIEPLSNGQFRINALLAVYAKTLKRKP